MDLAKEAVEGGVKSQPDSDDEEVSKTPSENQDEEQTDHETEDQLDAKEVDSAEEAEEEKEEIEELEVEEKEEENEKDVSKEDVAEFAKDEVYVDPAVEILTTTSTTEIILEDSSVNNDNKETELEKETDKGHKDAIGKVR